MRSRQEEPMSTSALIEEEQQLRAADGTALFVRRVRPPQESRRARLAWVHGVSEHGGRYLATMRWFAERGFDCAALDLRGHGRSGGRRVFVRRWHEYSEDVVSFLAHLAHEPSAEGQEGGATPLFLIGHSMGGLVVGRALQTHAERMPTLRGTVLMSPFFGIKVAVPGWKVALGRMLSRLLPWVSLPSDLDVSLLSKDEEVGRAYTEDPLVTDKVTARWYTEGMGTLGPMLADAGRIELPVLLMHGTDDGLTDPACTERVHAAVASPDKELKLWPGMRHELLNEVEKEQIRSHLSAWLEGRL
jgi:alpha-beta hydrolase superfamily lysophospholipase